VLILNNLELIGNVEMQETNLGTQGEGITAVAQNFLKTIVPEGYLRSSKTWGSGKGNWLAV
jgi:hypothetical protein